MVELFETQCIVSDTIIAGLFKKVNVNANKTL